MNLHKQKRFIVIAEDTSEKFEIGDILIQHEKFPSYWIGKNLYGSIKPEKYPHLFRELYWWEFRDESEMPEYLIVIADNMAHYGTPKGYVFKYKKATYEDDVMIEVLGKTFPLVYTQPATVEQYITFINSK